MKRVIMILFSLLILAGTLSLCVSAEQIEVTLPPLEQDHLEADVPPLEQDYFENSGPCYDFLNRYVDVDEFRSYLLEQFAKGEERISLSQFGIPYSRENCDFIYRYVRKDTPEAFHVDGQTIYYSNSTKMIVEIRMTYLYTVHEYQSMLSACREAAEKLMVGVADNKNLTDVEKALLIHDRLVLHCTYDQSKSVPNRYDMYGALAKGLAVCEGYTKAYAFMMDQIGIRNFYCQSIDLNHGWNILYIDGLPYHVDVTWDDPDRNGRVEHDNFLLSTDALIATGHGKNGTIDYNSSPSSKKYDQYFWKKSTAEFQLVGNNLYFIDNEASNLCKKTGENSSQILYSVKSTWRLDASRYWTNNYSVLSSACNSLLFSKADGVYAYHLSDGTVTTVYRPTLKNYMSIFAFSFKNGKLVCDIRNNPNPNAAGNGATTLTVSYTPAEKDHVYDSAKDVLCNICGSLKAGVKYLPGDVNGDLKVTSADAIYLLYHTLLGDSRYPLNQPVEYNGDGKVTSTDAIYLLYHVLLGDSRYPLVK